MTSTNDPHSPTQSSPAAPVADEARHKDGLERYKARLDFFKVALTVCVGTFGVAAMNAWYQDREKATSQAVEAAKIKNDEARIEIERIKQQVERRNAESRERLEEMNYLRQFMDIALSNAMEQRIRMAEFFSFLTLTPEFKNAWNQYYRQLSDLQKLDIELQEQIANAQRAGQLDEAAQLERKRRGLSLTTVALTLPRPNEANQAPPLAWTKPAIANCPQRLQERIEKLIVPHRKFPDSILWALGANGLATQDPQQNSLRENRTTGQPTTIRTILENYSEQLRFAASKHSVPIELLIALVATESGGNTRARVEVSAISDAGIGLTLILRGTARAVLKRPDISAQDLEDPRTNLEAAAAYIASLEPRTEYDPPLVAAAYSSGRVFYQANETNRWRLLAFPVGTSSYIDRFVLWFNDTFAVLKEDVKQVGDAPSFVRCLSATP